MKNKVLKLIQKNFDFFTFFIILLLAIAIRFYRIDNIPPPIHIDEAFMGQSAIAILEKSKNLLETYFSAPIVANIFTAFSIKLFGVHVETLRIQSVLFGIGTNVLLYLLAKDLFSKRIAFILFFIGNFSHLAIAYSRINIPPIQAPFFLILTLYLLNLAIKRKNTLLFLLGGLSTGLSLYSYTGAKIVIIVGLAFFAYNINAYFYKNVWENALFINEFRAWETQKIINQEDNKNTVILFIGNNIYPSYKSVPSLEYLTQKYNIMDIANLETIYQILNFRNFINYLFIIMPDNNIIFDGQILTKYLASNSIYSKRIYYKDIYLFDFLKITK